MQTLIQGIQRLQEGEIKRRSRGALFFRVWFQRMEMALILWFAGMTPVALPAVWGACLLLGIEMALLLAGFTVCSGIWGLPVFLATLFPQGIFYGLVGGMLFFWAFSGDKRPRLSGFLILLSVLGLGAALEVWAGPFFISLVTAHLSF